MNEIDLSNLTLAQYAKLKEQVISEVRDDDAKKRKQIREERKLWREMASEVVNSLVPKFQALNNAIMLLKMEAFESASALVAMRRELYNVKPTQSSFKFTNTEKTFSYTIGYYKKIKYDDSVEFAVKMVDDYINSLADSDNSEKLSKMLAIMLKRDDNDNLNPDRVAQLIEHIKDNDISELFDAVDVFIDSMRSQRSAWFVEAKTRNKANAWVPVPLNITSADFPEGFDVDFL